MNLIKNVNIDISQLKAEAQGRLLSIQADENAKYMIKISRASDTNLYNFDTEAFSVESSSCFFNATGSQSVAISFPAAASGDTYNISIFATVETEFIFTENKLFHSIEIPQVGNGTITFTAIGSGFTNTNVGSVTGSKTDSFVTTSSPTILMRNKQITNQAAEQDFGHFITNTIDEAGNNGIWDGGAFYWQTTEAIVANPAGDGVSNNAVTVADLTGLVVGMTLVFHKGAVAPSSTTVISGIDLDTKTITFSTSTAFEDSETMTFRAFGPRLIKQAIGIGFTITSPRVQLGQTTASVRTELTSSGPSINVSGTAGIGSGATIRMRGLAKNTSASRCVVNEIVGSLTAGSFNISNGEFEASSDRPIRVKTKIYIDGSSNQVFLSGNININRFTDSDETIHIDMSKITTQGQNSS